MGFSDIELIQMTLFVKDVTSPNTSSYPLAGGLPLQIISGSMDILSDLLADALQPVKRASLQGLNTIIPVGTILYDTARSALVRIPVPLHINRIKLRTLDGRIVTGIEINAQRNPVSPADAKQAALNLGIPIRHKDNPPRYEGNDPLEVEVYACHGTSSGTAIDIMAFWGLGCRPGNFRYSPGIGMPRIKMEDPIDLSCNFDVYNYAALQSYPKKAHPGETARYWYFDTYSPQQGCYLDIYDFYIENATLYMESQTIEPSGHINRWNPAIVNYPEGLIYREITGDQEANYCGDDPPCPKYGTSAYNRIAQRLPFGSYTVYEYDGMYRHPYLYIKAKVQDIIGFPYDGDPEEPFDPDPDPIGGIGGAPSIILAQQQLKNLSSWVKRKKNKGF